MMNEEEGPFLPAEINPWYVIATIHGEIENRRPDKLTPEEESILQCNRRIWNGIICRNMDKKDRKRLARKLDVCPLELEPLTEAKMKFVKNEVMRRIPGFQKTAIDELIESNFASFGHRIFKKQIYMRKFVFIDSDFSNSEFHDKIMLENSIFCNYTNFSNTKFYNVSLFSNSEFGYNPRFGNISLKDVKSGDEFGATHFDGANFYNVVTFEYSTFSGICSFNQTIFKGNSSFRNANFNHFVPTFYNSDLHNGVLFTDFKENWPDSNDDASGGKDAYSRLRQLMHEQLKPDEEQFFYRQEMAWKAHHEGSLWTKLYGCFSDYGYNLWKPLVGLALLFFPALFVEMAPLKDPLIDYWTQVGYGLQLSAANVFSLFGFQGQYLLSGNDFEDSWGTAGTIYWSVVSGMQSVFSVAFLFLFALALRNRFRLR